MIIITSQGGESLRRRVVVTGMGIVSPIGKSLKEYENSLKEGKIAIDRISSFDPSDLAAQIAAEIRDFNPADYMDKKLARRQDRFVQFALAATKMAVESSGVDLEKYKDRTAVLVSSGIGGLITLMREKEVLDSKGPGRVSPFMIPKVLINLVAGMISLQYDLRGPNFSPVSACASSLHSVAMGALLIRHGYADVAIVGGAEASIEKMGIAGFAAMRALSTRNDEPKKASRPFDKGRDGFVMGEGSGILVLEAEEIAKERNAEIMAEIKGIGMNDDAYHISAPRPDGSTMSQVMKLALEDAQMSSEDVDYVSAHATSTPAGDEVEARAIKMVFGDRAKDIKVNSTKTFMGHLLGAAGSAELIAAILQMRGGFVHGLPNLDDPDPETEGLGVADKEAQDWKIRNFLKNSFGFGGHNASVVVGWYE